MADDTYEIQKLLYLYCDRLDRGDFAGMAQLFAHARFEPGGAAAVQDDPAAIVRMYEDYTRIYPHTGTPGTRHVTTNPIIDIDEGGSTARCQSYVVVFQGIDDFPLQPVIAGRYFDRFEKVEGRWRFSERRIDIGHYGNLSRHLLQPFGPGATA